MCGRYYVDDEMMNEIRKIAVRIDSEQSMFKTGDVYPSQPAPVLTGSQAGLEAVQMLWSFPRYRQKGLLINARAEIALEKPTFRESVEKRRCIIPARHFYEWDKSKTKVTFYREGQHVLYLAGFYHTWEDARHFVILTTQANASVSPVHHRMPLVLEPRELSPWLEDTGAAEAMLKKTPVQLERYQEYQQQTLF